MFAVDSNLLIYAANAEFPGRQQMRKLLSEWSGSSEAWCITWSVVYEFMRVATHPAIFAHPLTFAEAWSFIESLFRSPSFGVLTETDRHAAVVRDLTREYPRISGNRLHDLHIAAILRENGVAEIRTADSGFHEFKFLRVVNPL